jgi:hypothetical protein
MFSQPHYNTRALSWSFSYPCYVQPYVTYPLGCRPTPVQP